MFFFSFYPNSIQKKMVQKLSLCGTLSKGINMYYLDIKKHPYICPNTLLVVNEYKRVKDTDGDCFWIILFLRGKVHNCTTIACLSFTAFHVFN